MPDKKQLFPLVLIGVSILVLVACAPPEALAAESTGAEVELEPLLDSEALLEPEPPPEPEPLPEPDAPDYDPEALSVIAVINEWRIEHDLWPLQPNPMLTDLALAQASFVASMETLPGDLHADPNGENPRDRATAYGWPSYGKAERVIIGENAYVGGSADEAIAWWDGSPTHNETMSRPDYLEIGVAAVPHEYGFVYFVVFGARPGVFTALVEPASRQLYLSNARYIYLVGMDDVPEFTSVQFLESADDSPDDAAWQPWEPVVTIPPDVADVFYVVYSDSENDVVIEVDIAHDIVWLPDTLS
jgi:uncharacterized protein YkwD